MYSLVTLIQKCSLPSTCIKYHSFLHIFDRYDFDSDGLISKEDVRMVLSYIPFKKEEGKILVYLSY